MPRKAITAARECISREAASLDVVVWYFTARLVFRVQSRTGLLAAPPPNIVTLTLLASIVCLAPALVETGEAAEKICRKCANGDDSPAACIDASIDGRKLSACRISGRPIRPRTCVHQVRA